MRYALILGFVLVARLTAAQSVPSVCDDGQCVQIASYNIELLGSHRKPFHGVSRGPRTDAQLEQIAKRIADDLDLEIVVFQEINTESDEWEKLKEKLKERNYEFIEGTTSDRNQFVILAWDADEVTLLDESAHEIEVRDEFDFGGGCEDEGLRMPVAGRFQAGEFDFWVIGVHLKSRSGGEDCTAKMRKEQCKDLVEVIEELAESSGEEDLLIVGDFNQRAGHSSFKPLADAGFVSQMTSLLPGSAKGSYVKSGLNDSTDLIDHVMIRTAPTKEVVGNSAFVMPIATADDAETYIIEQSDHVPIWVSFRNDEDLDDAP